MKKIIIFTAGIMGKTGLCTWIRNFCINMGTVCKITLLASAWSDDWLAELDRFVTCEKYDKEKTYECDIYLHNYQDNAIKGNIHARDIFVLLHCDYAEIGHFQASEGHCRYIAVSETSAKGMKEKFGIDCTAIKPFLTDYRPNRVYKFVSATRIHRLKGWDRMMQLCKLLQSNNIRFQWFLFTDGKINPTPYTGFLNMGEQPNNVIADYMADADYVVQLSDHEGYCYSVHESLSVGTPCLVSDIPVFQNVITDGYNGYRLPLNMENIPLDKILNNIPKDFVYLKDTEEIKQQWLARFET